MVQRWLRREFCPDGDHKKLDYCVSVLEPEMFIRLFTDITNCQFEEADSKMMEIGLAYVKDRFFSS